MRTSQDHVFCEDGLSFSQARSSLLKALHTPHFTGATCQALSSGGLAYSKPLLSPSQTLLGIGSSQQNPSGLCLLSIPMGNSDLTSKAKATLPFLPAEQGLPVPIPCLHGFWDVPKDVPKGFKIALADDESEHQGSQC